MGSGTLPRFWAVAISFVVSISFALLIRAHQDANPAKSATENLDWPAYGGGPLTIIIHR